MKTNKYKRRKNKLNKNNKIDVIKYEPNQKNGTLIRLEKTSSQPKGRNLNRV